MYYIMKNNISIRQFNKITELEMINGAYDTCAGVAKGGKQKYSSDRFKLEVIHCLASVVRQNYVIDPVEWAVSVKAVIGLMFDETTDVAKISQMDIAYLLPTPQGKTKVVFGGLVALPAGDSDTILTAVELNLDSNNIPPAFVGAMGTDGASPLMGCHNGVQVQFKRKHNLLLITSHCGNHKQALACEAAAKEVRYVPNFFSIVEHCGRFYNYSAKRTAGLKAHQEALNQPEIKTILSAFTRWLSHDEVTRILWLCLLSVLTHLFNTKYADASAASLYILMNDFRFVATLLLMRDVLPLMRKMSLHGAAEKVSRLLRANGYHTKYHTKF